METLITALLEGLIKAETLALVATIAIAIDPLLHWLDNRFPGKFDNPIIAFGMRIVRILKRYVSPTGLARTVAGSRVPIVGNPSSRTAQVDDAKSYNAF
jgi:hypothetical protein